MKSTASLSSILSSKACLSRSALLPRLLPRSSFLAGAGAGRPNRAANRRLGLRIGTSGFSSTAAAAAAAMADSFKPEQARAPPALPVPIPPLAKFKIGLCQLLVTADKERNIAHARKAIHEAVDKGAQLVILPEIWNSPYSNDSFPVYAEDIDGGSSPSTAMVSEAAKALKVTIVCGSIPERCGDRLYNTCCVFGSNGVLKAKHCKFYHSLPLALESKLWTCLWMHIHLFDIDIPGKITFMESKTLTAGESPIIVDTDVGRIGVGICYDIRFQELAMIYAARGAHLLCYPGAFNMTTGPLHWELLQRARAVDNQVVNSQSDAVFFMSLATCNLLLGPCGGNIQGHVAGPRRGGQLITGEHPYIETDFGPVQELSEGRLRPPLPADEDGQLEELVQIVCLSWDQDHSIRPPFSTITRNLGGIKQGAYRKCSDFGEELTRIVILEGVKSYERLHNMERF
ncbi:hypothetical protein ACJRO7_013759 [Eucalyptus globulus]|uniref:CN hydrolase domain-containing protein n=1 Tax=Eucalyptus globulus TaxID=34317 RepID=A0ABD3KXX3_EUCGL